MAKQLQPARKSYFFGKGYRDLWNTIKAAFQSNFQSAREIREKWWDGESKFMMLITFSACACIYIFGTAFTLAVSLIHVLVLGLFFVGVYIGFSVVWLVDRIYIEIKHISTSCPNDACQEHFKLPTYVCECGRHHTNLTPGSYGILHRTCLCGRKLPTTFFNGRENISAICPHCGTVLKGSLNRQISIPIIGTKATGKTCYVNMAVALMKDQIAPERGWTFEFYDESDSMNFERAFYRLGSGEIPEGTADHQATAYKFLLSSPDWKIPKQVYIYDVAGEIFNNTFEVGSQRAYAFSNGFLILIDPFSMAEFAAEFEEEETAAAGAITNDLNDMLDVLLVNLETMYNLKSKDMMKTGLAIVINKTDMVGLEDLIGESAVQKFQEEHPEYTNRMQIYNILGEAFLQQYGAGNFLRTVKSKFDNIQFFTCSVLGHEPDGTMFEPTRVEEPIMWLLNMEDSDIK